MIARAREDRLVRWSLYGAAPFLWLALALFDPVLLLVPPLVALALWAAMRYGIIERHDPVEVDDLDYL